MDVGEYGDSVRPRTRDESLETLCTVLMEFVPGIQQKLYPPKRNSRGLNSPLPQRRRCPRVISAEALIQTGSNRALRLDRGLLGSYWLVARTGG